MKKKLFLLTTFLISFVMFSSSVRADEYPELSCLYNGNEDCSHWWTLGINFCVQGMTLITQSASGDINIYYTKDPITNRSDLYNYPIKNAKLYKYDKYEDKNKLYSSSQTDHKNQFKNNGCPKYVNYDNGRVEYTYDEPEEGKNFSSYYPLLSTEPIPKSTTNNSSKELTCNYPALSYQKKLEIEQSSNGEITTIYDGDEKKLNLHNDNSEEDTGYNVKTGNFDFCPICANKSGDDVYFYNGEEDGSCKTSYAGFKNTDNSEWIYTCNYAMVDDAKSTVTLYYNEENFKIELTYTDQYKHIVSYGFTASELWNSNSNSCPSFIYSNFQAQYSDLDTFYLKEKGHKYLLISSSGGEEKKEISGGKEPENCKELIGEDVIEIINEVMKVIRIVVPILLLIFGIIDFFRATFANGEDDMKKSRDRFFKRIIAAIIVFLVPIFVNLVLKISNTVWSDINQETCIEE